MPDIRKGTTLAPSGRSSQTNETGSGRRPSQTNEHQQDLGLLTTQDLNNILEVNQKALTIYLEVERQNEHILEVLQEESEKLERIEVVEDELKEVRRETGDNAETLKDIKKKLEEIDKNMFRLVLILGSAGIGTIITIIQAFLTHK